MRGKLAIALITGASAVAMLASPSLASAAPAKKSAAKVLTVDGNAAGRHRIVSRDGVVTTYTAKGTEKLATRHINGTAFSMPRNTKYASTASCIEPHGQTGTIWLNWDETAGSLSVDNIYLTSSTSYYISESDEHAYVTNSSGVSTYVVGPWTNTTWVGNRTFAATYKTGVRAQAYMRYGLKSYWVPGYGCTKTINTD